MTKGEALLWTARLHEAIRCLPDDADIYNFDLAYDHGNSTERKVTLLLYAPVDISPVLDSDGHEGWSPKYVNLTPFAQAWWAHSEGGNGSDA